MEVLVGIDLRTLRCNFPKRRNGPLKLHASISLAREFFTSPAKTFSLRMHSQDKNSMLLEIKSQNRAQPRYTESSP